MTGAGDDAAAVTAWWHDLRVAALVGTARRPVPEPPGLGLRPREVAAKEHRLLDDVALADALLRAGRLPVPAPPAVAAAEPETLPAAPATAVQLLELLLSQGTLSGASRDEVVLGWLQSAAAAGCIVPARLLPVLLDLGGRQQPLRAAIRPVLGSRGRWLAARNPAWSWAGASPATGAATDPERPGAAPATGPDLTAAVAAERRLSAPAGRRSVEALWESLSAPDRAAAVAGLIVGVSGEDEELLERCLDDRSRAVRQQGSSLLDRLPASRRAMRMAGRLRGLVRVAGPPRAPCLLVELPDEPDEEARRDGLEAGPAGAGASRRDRWLRRIVAGAPLEVWTDLVDGGPERVVAAVAGDQAQAVLAGISDAAASRRQVDWARALAEHTGDSRLVALLPTAERDAVLCRRLARHGLARSLPELAQAPTPWGAELSAAVVAALRREHTLAGHAARVLRDRLTVGLHPSTAPAVERLLASAGEDATLRSILRTVLQHQSLLQAIREAFR